MNGIRPALTPEEWARALTLGQYPGRPFNREMRHEAAVSWVEGGAESEGHTPDEGAHGAAAILLAGQPFGFTWAMVAAIEKCAQIAQEEYGWDKSGPSPWLPARAAAARIAALLPPRGP